MNTESLIAIIVAGGSFVFTLYQWLISMNSKRPRMRLIRFKLNEAYLNDDHKIFNLLPKYNFIFVNLSDLPNAVLSMKVFCFVGRQWREGKMRIDREVERTESVPVYDHQSRRHSHETRVRRVRESAEIFPIIMQPHSSATCPEGLSGYLSFPEYPSEKELDDLRIRVEVSDQYDKKYRFHFQRKDFTDLEVSRRPRFREEENKFGEIRATNPKDNSAIVVRGVFVRNQDQPQQSRIDIRQYYEYSDSSLKSITAERMHDEMQKGEGDRVTVREGSDVNLFLHKQAKEIEVEITVGEKPKSQKFAFPQEFMELYNQYGPKDS